MMFIFSFWQKALYRFRSSGPPELVEILEMALESQWLHGYPRPAPRGLASPKITGLPLHPSCQGATWRATAHSWNLQAPGLGKKQMEDAQIVEYCRCWPGIAMELCGSQVLVRYATVDGFRLSSLWLPSDCRNFQILSESYWTLVEVRQMLNLVPEAQTVLDPFCGSGTTPLALGDGHVRVRERKVCRSVVKRSKSWFVGCQVLSW